jgi:hypothetical protein
MMKPPEDVSEQLRALIGKTARCDRQAFAALYNATAPQLFGVALRIIGRRDPAGEVPALPRPVWSVHRNFRITCQLANIACNFRRGGRIYNRTSVIVRHSAGHWPQ